MAAPPAGSESNGSGGDDFIQDDDIKADQLESVPLDAAVDASLLDSLGSDIGERPMTAALTPGGGSVGRLSEASLFENMTAAHEPELLILDGPSDESEDELDTIGGLAGVMGEDAGLIDGEPSYGTDVKLEESTAARAPLMAASAARISTVGSATNASRPVVRPSTAHTHVVRSGSITKKKAKDRPRSALVASSPYMSQFVPSVSAWKSNRTSGGSRPASEGGAGRRRSSKTGSEIAGAASGGRWAGEASSPVGTRRTPGISGQVQLYGSSEGAALRTLDESQGGGTSSIAGADVTDASIEDDYIMDVRMHNALHVHGKRERKKRKVAHGLERVYKSSPYEGDSSFSAGRRQGRLSSAGGSGIKHKTAWRDGRATDFDQSYDESSLLRKYDDASSMYDVDSLEVSAVANADDDSRMDSLVQAIGSTHGGRRRPFSATARFSSSGSRARSARAAAVRKQRVQSGTRRAEVTARKRRKVRPASAAAGVNRNSRQSSADRRDPRRISSAVSRNRYSADHVMSGRLSSRIPSVAERVHRETRPISEFLRERERTELRQKQKLAKEMDVEVRRFLWRIQQKVNEVNVMMSVLGRTTVYSVEQNDPLGGTDPRVVAHDDGAQVVDMSVDQFDRFVIKLKHRVESFQSSERIRSSTREVYGSDRGGRERHGGKRVGGRDEGRKARIAWGSDVVDSSDGTGAVVDVERSGSGDTGGDGGAGTGTGNDGDGDKGDAGDGDVTGASSGELESDFARGSAGGGAGGVDSVGVSNASGGVAAASGAASGLGSDLLDMLLDSSRAGASGGRGSGGGMGQQDGMGHGRVKESADALRHQTREEAERVLLETMKLIGKLRGQIILLRRKDLGLVDEGEPLPDEYLRDIEINTLSLGT